jgi:hypothetical protein
VNYRLCEIAIAIELIVITSWKKVEVSNRFAALEDLVTAVETNSAWETVRENVKI